jgi:hypothetical protein
MNQGRETNDQGNGGLEALMEMVQKMRSQNQWQ